MLLKFEAEVNILRPRLKDTETCISAVVYVSAQSVTRTVTGATTVTFVFLRQPGVTDTDSVLTVVMKFQDAEVVGIYLFEPEYNTFNAFCIKIA